MGSLDSVEFQDGELLPSDLPEGNSQEFARHRLPGASDTKVASTFDGLPSRHIEKLDHLHVVDRRFSFFIVELGWDSDDYLALPERGRKGDELGVGGIGVGHVMYLLPPWVEVVEFGALLKAAYYTTS